MREYLVYHKDVQEGFDFKNGVMIIKADSIEKAKIKFATLYAPKYIKLFSECLLDAETFCRDIDSYENGVHEEILIENIKKYFKGTNFADDFIKAFFSFGEIEILPVDMLTHYLLKEDERINNIIVKPLDEYRIE